MATSSYNLPILTIPLHMGKTKKHIMGIIMIPHVASLRLSTRRNPADHDNNNPRGVSHTEALKKRLGPDFAAYERARSCHNNNLEAYPLLVAAIFAGYLAEKQAGVDAVGLRSFSIAWLVIRLLYTFNYLTTEKSKAMGAVRTGLWGACMIWAVRVLVSSAAILA